MVCLPVSLVQIVVPCVQSWDLLYGLSSYLPVSLVKIVVPCVQPWDLPSSQMKELIPGLGTEELQMAALGCTELSSELDLVVNNTFNIVKHLICKY